MVCCLFGILLPSPCLYLDKVQTGYSCRIYLLIYKDTRLYFLPKAHLIPCVANQIAMWLNLKLSERLRHCGARHCKWKKKKRERGWKAQSPDKINWEHKHRVDCEKYVVTFWFIGLKKKRNHQVQKMCRRELFVAWLLLGKLHISPAQKKANKQRVKFALANDDRVDNATWFGICSCFFLIWNIFLWSATVKTAGCDWLIDWMNVI